MFLEGYQKTSEGWVIIANHEIAGVSPQMVDWFWDHLTDEIYKKWHPTDHVSLKWLRHPSLNGHVGAIHRVEEYFNGFPPEKPATLDIRWEDPAQAKAYEYEHVLLATGTGENGRLNATLMHEYQTASYGIQMRSHFLLSQEAPEVVIGALYEHNKQEMANLALFLPNLYYEEVELPSLLDTGFFERGNMRITKELIRSASGKERVMYCSWKNNMYDVMASSASMLLEIQNIHIHEWSFCPNLENAS